MYFILTIYKGYIFKAEFKENDHQLENKFYVFEYYIRN